MSKKRVAVVGSGVSGLVSAYMLVEGGAEVVLYEKEDYLGGHAKTVTVDGTQLDLGFMVFNRVSHISSFFFLSKNYLVLRFLYINYSLYFYFTLVFFTYRS